MTRQASHYLYQKATELIGAGFDGKSVACALSALVDTVTTSCYESSLDPGSRPPGLALVAVGGYGRRELAPCSDIDIMLLASSKDRINTEAAESVLYRLWDTGLTISHAFRTPDECVEDALDDVKTRTALIESRLVAGNRDLFDDFRRNSYQKILYRRKKRFIADMMRDIERRHHSSGDSPYILEPNVKEGRGGLRDVHSLWWLARVMLNVSDAAGLQEAVSEMDFRRFAKAHDFLLKVRACLHSPARRGNDILSFEVEDDVARTLRIHDTKSFHGAEILMRIYYRKATDVANALARVMHLCGRRYFSLPAFFGTREVDRHFSIWKNEIVIKDRAALKSPEKIIEAFHLFSVTGKRLSQQGRDVLIGSSLHAGKTGWSSKRAVQLFSEILKGNRVYETLRIMHETMALGRLIPEFGRLRHLVIREPYHRYTVDEHSLIAIKNLEMLRFNKQERLQYLADIFARVRQEVLYLAVLLHDVGKGTATRHDEAGYRIIRDVLDRLNLSNEDRKTVEFLVRNHILLSKLTLTRDVEAPETISQLAEAVEVPQNLDALYLMTYADVSAVNPGFWSDWKAYLFHEVYTKTMSHLQGMMVQYREVPDPDLKRFLDDMPYRYLVSRQIEALYEDYERSRQVTDGEALVSAQERADGTSELTVVTGDAPGLFSRIVGVLSSRGLNILRARLYTGKSGLVIDRIVISNWKDLWWEGLEKQIRDEINRAVFGGPRDTRRFSPPGSPDISAEDTLRHMRTERYIEIDNETSEEHTLLELQLPDRLGLLYEMTTHLCQGGIDIISAVINTEDSLARDVFYIQHEGRKLDAPAAWGLLSSLSQSELTLSSVQPVSPEGGR